MIYEENVSRLALEESARSLRLKKMNRHIVLAALLIGDILCIIFAHYVPYNVYGQFTFIENPVFLISTMIIIYLIIALNMSTFSLRIIARDGGGTVRAIRALLVSYVILLLAAFLLKVSDDFSRVLLVVSAALTILFIGMFRHMVFSRLNDGTHSLQLTTVLLCDDISIAPEGSPHFTVTMSAASLFDPTCPTPESYDRLARALRNADRVVVAASSERRMMWSMVLKAINIRSEVIAPELENLAPLQLSAIGQLPTLIMSEGPLTRVDAYLKRAFDVAFALLAIIATFPVLAMVALAIKLDSPGPILFKQVRVGQDNRQFVIFKFRSMIVDQGDSTGHRSASRCDQRVTRIGRFIRSTSIDELPQLFNVLIGDMSIVGPRPHALGSRADDMLFWDIDDRYWLRHAVKPGLTGLAQIRGLRGATDSRTDLTQRLQADLEYVRGWTIWRDIRVILLTFRVLIHNRAY
jgi:exopolysaccharide biosynthesis polyprenyl glycosylphosphotransferase